MKLTSTLALFATLLGTVLSVAHAATETDGSNSATTPAAPGFSYLGCIAEGGTSTSLRALTGASFTQTNMTPLVCQSLCSGYRYAGIEIGTQCFCGNSFSHGATGNAIPESNCPTPCGGDPSQKCGGAWTLSLYGKPAPTPIPIPTPTPTSAPPAPTNTGFSSLGCIAEGGTSTSLRALTGASLSQPNMTSLVCQSFCSGYRYAGVEIGVQCMSARVREWRPSNCNFRFLWELIQ
ncbi:WSC domain-containing protein [Infundibulicybe gibba]|nr:WSC domain-containing protein [Infundibulicybe gibba]